MENNKRNMLNSQEICIFVNNTYMKMIRIINVFLIPVGILAAVGIPVFITDKKIENLIYTVFTLGCSIFLFAFWMWLRKKKIRVIPEGIWYHKIFLTSPIIP